MKWLLTFRWHLLGLFLSDLGRSMIENKYDAFTTDNGYRAAAVGSNPVGRAVDAIVRRRDTHVALRQRLEIVVGALVECALAKRHQEPLRLVSGPVGLGRDIRTAWLRLEGLNSRPADWLEVIGVDLDDSGTVLDEASRLAADEDVPLQAYRRDLLDPAGLTEAIDGRADIFNSIGLSTWLDADGLDRLLRSIRSCLAQDGVLIIDHWRRHRGSKYAAALQMPARYITDHEFESALESAGFGVYQKQATANGVVVVYQTRPT